MTKTRTQQTSDNVAILYRALCSMIAFLATLIIVPVWVGLSAGVAGLSLIVFGVSTVLVGRLFFEPKRIPRFITIPTFALSLFGLIAPQLAYIQTAARHNTNLHFNPYTYIQFSGATDIEPDKILPYKSVDSRTLNIAFYESTMKGQRPLVVILHGGAWRYGSHLETGAWPRLLTSQGFHVASIEYRLASDSNHTWKDAPNDVHDAMSYLKEHESRLLIKPDRLHLLGQSAGGHLALLEAYRHQTVRSVVSLYAPIDLALDYETSRDKSAELDFIGGPPRQFPQRYEAVSPVHYVRESSPTSLLIQGTRDDLVSTKNVARLSSKLSQYNVSHQVLLLPFTGHSFENQRGGFATQIAEQSVINFLK